MVLRADVAPRVGLLSVLYARVRYLICEGAEAARDLHADHGEYVCRKEQVHFTDRVNEDK